MTEQTEKWTGPDKVLHFVMIGGVPAFIVTLMTSNPLIGVAVGCALGAGKEVLDWLAKNSTVSYKDFLVTCAGGGAGGLVGFLAGFVMT